MNCKEFKQEYSICADLQWQLILGFLRKALTTSSPVEAIFQAIKNPQSVHAQATMKQNSLRLNYFWYMNGLGTPSSCLLPLLAAMHTPYGPLILNLQRQVSKTNQKILWAGSKKLGAYQCTSLDAC